MGALKKPLAINAHRFAMVLAVLWKMGGLLSEDWMTDCRRLVCRRRADILVYVCSLTTFQKKEGGGAGFDCFMLSVIDDLTVKLLRYVHIFVSNA